MFLWWWGDRMFLQGVGIFSEGGAGTYMSTGNATQEGQRLLVVLLLKRLESEIDLIKCFTTRDFNNLQFPSSG